MSKTRCVLCGQVIPPLEGRSLPLCFTGQPVCPGCWEEYQSAQQPRRAELEERALASPHLLSPDVVKANLADYRARQEEQRKKRARRNVTCCGREMEGLGVFQFQLGRQSLLTGGFSNLLSGALSLSVFQCPSCGRYKFYDPD